MSKSEGKESFDEAVNRRLDDEKRREDNKTKDLQDTAGEEHNGSRRDNEPALEEQNEQGNPSKPDNE